MTNRTDWNAPEQQAKKATFYAGKAFKHLEFEDQARVRQLMRAGLIGLQHGVIVRVPQTMK